VAVRSTEDGEDGTHIAEGDVMCRQNPAILALLAQAN
jgi:hypothetical protein